MKRESKSKPSQATTRSAWQLGSSLTQACGMIALHTGRTMSRALPAEMLGQPPVGRRPAVWWRAVDPATGPAYTTTYPESAAVASHKTVLPESPQGFGHSRLTVGPRGQGTPNLPNRPMGTPIMLRLRKPRLGRDCA
jgi:hypothetical protein